MLRPCVRCQQVQSALRIEVSSVFWYVVLPAICKQVHIMSLDRPVIDLCWRVLYIAKRLVGFGYNIVPNCLCDHPLETLYHLFFFFACPLAQSGISWAHSLIFRAAPLTPTLKIAIFFLVSPTMNFLSSRWCLFICETC